MLAGTFGALLALTGCGSSAPSSSNAPPANDAGEPSVNDAGAHTDGGAQTGPAMSINDYCTASANLDAPWCTYVNQCCSAADKQDVMFAPPGCILGTTDPKDCIDRLTKQTGDGSVAFHGEYAQACIGELQKWVPAAPTGCSGVHFSDHMLTGHASPAFAQIEACRQTEQGQLKSGGSCLYDTQCTEGLRCRSYAASSTDFRCQPLSKQFEPCNLRSDCDTGLTCIGEVGAATCDTLHGVGQACLFATDCQDGLLCGGSSCVEPPPMGGSCTSANGFTCGPLLGCNSGTETCVNLGANGATCSTSGQCQGRCDATTMTCVSICGGTW
jgi:hypothetical protein